MKIMKNDSNNSNNSNNKCMFELRFNRAQLLPANSLKIKPANSFEASYEDNLDLMCVFCVTLFNLFSVRLPCLCPHR